MHPLSSNDPSNMGPQALTKLLMPSKSHVLSRYFSGIEWLVPPLRVHMQSRASAAKFISKSQSASTRVATTA
jgi:hypothetical protein